MESLDFAKKKKEMEAKKEAQKENDKPQIPGPQVEVNPQKSIKWKGNDHGRKTCKMCEFYWKRSAESRIDGTTMEVHICCASPQLHPIAGDAVFDDHGDLVEEKLVRPKCKFFQNKSK